MKTVMGFIFVVLAAVCAACATEASRTLPALPDPPSALQIQQSLEKTPSGDYPGYQRIVADGHERYCRRNLNPLADDKVVCVTEAQVRIEHFQAQQALQAQQSQLAQAQMLKDATRPPTPNIDARQNAMQMQQSANTMPGQYMGQH